MGVCQGRTPKPPEQGLKRPQLVTANHYSWAWRTVGLSASPEATSSVFSGSLRAEIASSQLTGPAVGSGDLGEVLLHQGGQPDPMVVVPRDLC